MVKKRWLYIIAAFLFVGIVWGIMYRHTMQHMPSTGSMEDHALRGDSFGHLSALFAGLAFVGVIAALFLQREDINAALREQRLSASAQQVHARIAALSAGLAARTAINSQIDCALKLNPQQKVTIGDKTMSLTDFKVTLIAKTLEANAKLDALLKEIEDGVSAPECQ